jgi:hypothetical protein
MNNVFRLFAALIVAAFLTACGGGGGGGSAATEVAATPTAVVASAPAPTTLSAVIKPQVVGDIAYDTTLTVSVTGATSSGVAIVTKAGVELARVTVNNGDTSIAPPSGGWPAGTITVSVSVPGQSLVTSDRTVAPHPVVATVPHYTNVKFVMVYGYPYLLTPSGVTRVTNATRFATPNVSNDFEMTGCAYAIKPLDGAIIYTCVETTTGAYQRLNFVIADPSKALPEITEYTGTLPPGLEVTVDAQGVTVLGSGWSPFAGGDTLVTPEGTYAIVFGGSPAITLTSPTGVVTTVVALPLMASPDLLASFSNP